MREWHNSLQRKRAARQWHSQPSDTLKNWKIYTRRIPHPPLPQKKSPSQNGAGVLAFKKILKIRDRDDRHNERQTVCVCLNKHKFSKESRRHSGWQEGAWRGWKQARQAGEARAEMCSCPDWSCTRWQQITGIPTHAALQWRHSTPTSPARFLLQRLFVHSYN